MEHLLIMPAIGAVGLVVILVILLIMKSSEKQEHRKIVDVSRFDSFTEEIRRENAELKREL